MANNNLNSQWITIVLITAVLMLVFLVFYGNKSNTTAPITNPLPVEKPVIPTLPQETSKTN